MSTENSCTTTQRLVRWNINYIEQGLEAPFPPHEELIRADMSEQEFETWKIAQFVEALPYIDQPPLWKAKNFPPAARDGKINALPPGAGKYLRVVVASLDTFERPSWDYEETQVRLLREIRDAIEGRTPPHPHPTRIRLPKTGVLAGPLNWNGSEFGDEFLNMPAFLGASPAAGHTKLTGWMQVLFAPPQGDWVDFTFQYFGVGTPVEITFGGGQQFDFVRTRIFPTPFFLQGGKPLDTTNRGKLNLCTGEVKDVIIFSNFQGTTIGRTDRVNRIPYAFPYTFPPLSPPASFVPPPDYRPPNPMPSVFADVRFRATPDGTLTGFEVHSFSFAPTGLFPYFIGPDGYFPPFTFGPNFGFYFANPDRCLPGTPPADCPNDSEDPDGIRTSSSTFFHPHIDFVADRMVAATPGVPAPVSLGAPLADAVVVAVGEKLYVLGGVDEKGKVSRRAQIYDRTANAWSDGPDLPEAVTSAQGAVVGGKIYLLGGFKDAGKTLSDRVQVLDLAGNSWSSPYTVPTPVAEGTATAVGARIYLVSGWRATGKGKLKITSAVQVLDTASGTWNVSADFGKDPAAPPPASMPAVGAAAVALGASIYVIGGRTSDKEISRRTVILETDQNLWNVGPSTAVAVYEATAAAIDGRILLIGGRPSVDGPTQPFDATFLPCQELDLDLNTWRGSLPQVLPAAGAGAGVVGDAVIVVGGWVQGFLDPAPGSATRLAQVFRPAAGWASDPSIPVYTSAQLIKPPIAPGALVLIVGANLAPAPGAPAPGVEITVAGKSCQILDVLPFRIVFRIPTDLDPKLGQAAVVLKVAGAQSQAVAVSLPVADVSPALFLYSYGEVAEPAFLLDNGNLAGNGDALDPKAPALLNYAQQPVSPGGVITVFGTGFGGNAAKIKATVGGRGAKVVGVADDPLPGVQRLALEVPADAQLATFSPAQVTVHGIESNVGGLSIRKAGEIPPPPQPLPLEMGLFFLLGPFPGLGLLKLPSA